MNTKSIPDYFHYLVDRRNSLASIKKFIERETEKLGRIPPDHANNWDYQYLVSEMAKSVAHVGKLAKDHNIKEFQDVMNQDAVSDNVKYEMLAIIEEITKLNEQIVYDMEEFQRKLSKL